MKPSTTHENTDSWLPDLCNSLAFLRLVLLSVFIAISLSLLKQGSDGFQFEMIGSLSLYSVWVVFTVAIGLCQLRRWGRGMSTLLSVFSAVLWLFIASSLCALAAYQFSDPFGQSFGLSSPSNLFFGLSGGNPQKMLFSLWLYTVLITLILGCCGLRFLYVHY